MLFRIQAFMGISNAFKLGYRGYMGAVMHYHYRRAASSMVGASLLKYSKGIKTTR